MLAKGCYAVPLKMSPSVFRKLAGRLPIRIGIDQTARLLVPALDPIFGNFKIQYVKIGTQTVSIKSEYAQERALAYFFNNIIYKFKMTPLFKLLSDIEFSKNDLFVDVGANFGIYSILAKELGYRVLLFEPEKTCFQFLERNFKPDEVHQIALSNKDGEAEFLISSLLGGSSLVPAVKYKKSTEYVDSYKVTVRSGSTAIKDIVGDVGAVRLIKIDVEGEEENVLEGLLDLIQATNPIVWCEVRGPQSDRSPNSFVRCLSRIKKIGYDCLLYNGREFTPLSEDYNAPQVFDVCFKRS